MNFIFYLRKKFKFIIFFIIFNKNFNINYLKNLYNNFKFYNYFSYFLILK